MAESERIAVFGAGAFGTALAMALAAAGREVVLWGRDGGALAEMAARRENAAYLPGLTFPEGLSLEPDAATALKGAGTVLLAVPAQALRGLLEAFGPLLAGRVLVACCKGVERGSGLLPSEIITAILPGAAAGVLTGPSFAADIAAGKPTALTLAFAGGAPDAEAVQARLSTPALRLYLGDDLAGAQLGGALKNVMAIAAGIVIGAGLGDSARAALMTRGFAEMARYAEARGARRETLFGLSGFGDLVLTCTSSQSRNFRFGLEFGAGRARPEGLTVEGVATALAVSEAETDLDLPLTRAVAALIEGRQTLPETISALMSRPLRREG